MSWTSEGLFGHTLFQTVDLLLYDDLLDMVEKTNLTAICR